MKLSLYLSLFFPCFPLFSSGDITLPRRSIRRKNENVCLIETETLPIDFNWYWLVDSNRSSFFSFVFLFFFRAPLLSRRPFSFLFFILFLFSLFFVFFFVLHPLNGKDTVETIIERIIGPLILRYR